MNLAIIPKSTIATGVMNKNVACHPKLSTIAPPVIKPITAPPDNVELNMPRAIASFSGGNLSLIILKGYRKHRDANALHHSSGNEKKKVGGQPS